MPGSLLEIASFVPVLENLSAMQMNPSSGIVHCKVSSIRSDVEEVART